MITPTEFEQINTHLLNRDLNAAEQALKKLKPESNTEKRTLGHFTGILLFQREQVLAAKTHLEETLRIYGENVNLLRDLIVCQYHLHDMSAFRHGLRYLEELLCELKDQLSERSLLECELCLGKFLEEEARLAPAHELYERALARAQNPLHRLRALIQMARWQALYEPSSELSTLYRELISFPGNKLSADLRVELEHSLMLVELRLIGGDHAWQRILRVEPTLAEMDRRLLLFDFIEGLLNQDVKISPEVQDKMKGLQRLDPFENFLFELIQGRLEAQLKIQALAVLAPQLPWASYLRLLCLSANLEANGTVRQELNRKIQLILRALDPKSHSLWNRRLREALQTPEIRMEYSARNRSVLIQGRHVDLSKKKIGMQLLEGLTKKPELSIDEAIDLLWQSSFSPEHYHRLRMGIHRLNSLMNKVTGLGKIIEVDSQSVRLRPEVKIRHADTAQSYDDHLSL